MSRWLYGLITIVIILNTYKSWWFSIIYSPRADIRPVTPSTSAAGLLSATEPSNEVYIRHILCFYTIAAIFYACAVADLTSQLTKIH